MSQFKNIFKSENQVDFFTKQAVIAALYVALTLLFTPLSYGTIQFRISELLMLFILVDKRYIVGLTLGVFVANIFSPLGVIDLIFGTSATLIGLLLYIIIANENIYHRAVTFITTLTVANALIIGAELTYLGFAENGFFFAVLSVGISELILMIIAFCIYMFGKEIFQYFKIK